LGGSNLLPFTYIDNVVGRSCWRLSDVLGGKVPSSTTVKSRKKYLNRYLQATGAQLRVFRPHSSTAAAHSTRQMLEKGVIKKKHLPTRYGMASKYRSLRYSSQKAKQQLNWQPKVSLEDEATFDWYNGRIKR
jgi:nucleoside-diphosphate-sugar epimerase